MDSFRPINLKNQVFPRPSERGSAVLWVFIIIALFAALNFAFMQNTRSGGGSADITAEKTRLLATEIIDYGRVARDTTKQLKINGCTDTQISFEQGGAYVNAATPSDNHCKLFHASGGGLLWEKISVESGGTMGFTGQEGVAGIGTAAPELVLKWEGISLDLCKAVNQKLGVTGTSNDPPHSATGTCDLATAGCKFTGTYTATYTITNGDNDFTGKPTGCYDEAGGGNYIFYQVLVTR
jgi:hypothetical protein